MKGVELRDPHESATRQLFVVLQVVPPDNVQPVHENGCVGLWDIFEESGSSKPREKNLWAHVFDDKPILLINPEPVECLLDGLQLSLVGAQFIHSCSSQLAHVTCSLDEPCCE